MTCQLMIGREFSLSTNAPSRLVHTHSFGVWCGNEFRKLIFTLDSLSEGVESGGTFKVFGFVLNYQTFLFPISLASYRFFLLTKVKSGFVHFWTLGRSNKEGMFVSFSISFE